MERRKARAAVLAALFQWDLVGQDGEQALHRCVGDAGLGRRGAAFAEGLMSGILEHRTQIDDLVSDLAVDWRLERMSAVDRNILRIGAYELQYSSDVPLNVAINEAVELAKTFSTPEGARFINGILGEMARRSGAGVHR